MEFADFLPYIWGTLLIVAVFMYVLLDGFDLGIGMLFSLRKKEEDRALMMNSIAPFWDGNETWLVLGGGGLLVAFPLAYAIMMSALYLPVTFMLLGLIFRGVSFEFRFKAEKTRPFWDKAFFSGSLVAAFFQGVILGAYVQGIEVDGREFSGGIMDWLSAFSVTTGIAVVCGYIYMGSSWLIMRTEGEIQEWAYKTAKKSLVAVTVFMSIVIFWMPLLHADIPLISAASNKILHGALAQRWFGGPQAFLTVIIPLGFIVSVICSFKAIKSNAEFKPFIFGILIFVTGFSGLAFSVWPNVIPGSISLQEAAAAPASLTLVLIGAIVFLPVILGYTAYVYWVFRGKVRHGDDFYH